MKKNIVKKGLAYGMIVLFFGACVVVGATNNIVETDSYNGETHTPFANVAMNSEPILKVEINPILYLFTISYSVENIGGATAHNVTYSNVSFEGNVLYNSRPMILAQELEPGQKTHGNTDIFIGFGLFTVTISVTCDEGVSDTTSANGIVFGPLYFIPWTMGDV